MCARIQSGSRFRFSGPNATSSATVRPMIWVSGSWKTIALLSWNGDRRSTSLPETMIRPEISPAGIRPFKQTQSVLLPAPEGPVMPTNSPRRTTRSIPSSASRSGYRNRSPSTSMAFSPGCASSNGSGGSHLDRLLRRRFDRLVAILPVEAARLDHRVEDRHQDCGDNRRGEAVVEQDGGRDNAPRDRGGNDMGQVEPTRDDDRVDDGTNDDRPEVVARDRRRVLPVRRLHHLVRKPGHERVRQETCDRAQSQRAGDGVADRHGEGDTDRSRQSEQN